MSGTNINQFECLVPVSSSMMARLITTCTCTIIHGKQILNHYNKSSMTGNSCCKRLVVFWSCRSADVVACADCPRPTCRATGCKICEKPRLFHWKVGMAALRKGGWDHNRKMCFKLCFIFSSFKWLWDWILEILPSARNSLYKTMCLLYFGPPNHGDTCF